MEKARWRGDSIEGVPRMRDDRRTTKPAGRFRENPTGGPADAGLARASSRDGGTAGPLSPRRLASTKNPSPQDPFVVCRVEEWRGDV